MRLDLGIGNRAHTGAAVPLATTMWRKECGQLARYLITKSRNSPHVHLGNGFVVTVTTCHNENRLASQAAEMLGNNSVSLPNLGFGQLRIHVNACVIENDVRLSFSEGCEGRRLYNHRLGGLKMKSFCARFLAWYRESL